MQASGKIKMAKLAGLFGALALSTVGFAGQAKTDYIQAEVISSTPIYQTVEIPSEREVCWNEEVQYRRGKSKTPSLVGGLIGGAVGNQFGGGNGRRALTVAGALIGASIGNDSARKNARRSDVEVEQRCRVEREYFEEERITGYRVRYEYNGQEYTTRTDQDPGEYIDLRVSVSPVVR